MVPMEEDSAGDVELEASGDAENTHVRGNVEMRGNVEDTHTMEATDLFVKLRKDVDLLEQRKIWQYRIFMCSLAFFALYSIIISNIWKQHEYHDSGTNTVQIFAFDNDLLPMSSLARDQALIEKFKSASFFQLTFWGLNSAVDTLQQLRDKIMDIGLGSVFALAIIVYLLVPDSKKPPIPRTSAASKASTATTASTVSAASRASTISMASTTTMDTS